jgi:hypothetical protein
MVLVVTWQLNFVNSVHRGALFATGTVFQSAPNAHPT